MSEPVLVTGAAGGSQGSTGRRITSLLLEKGIPVRAFVHKLDARSDALRELGAEVVQGDLLDRDSVRASLTGRKRAYFTYSVPTGMGGTQLTRAPSPDSLRAYLPFSLVSHPSGVVLSGRGSRLASIWS